MAMPEKMLTIKEYAAKTNYSERQIRQFCIDGKISGAKKLTDGTRKWLIPASAVQALGKSGTTYKVNMKLKVRMNDKGRVEAIERDDKTPNWITKYQQANQQKLPNVPKWLYPVLIIRDAKGSRILTNSNESLFVSKQLEVMPFSGQWWNSLRDDRKAQVLELVEWLGGDPDEYVNSNEVMYPLTPRGMPRK